MDVEEGEAVDALKRLGLSEYESKVFIALQRLGVGTARDIYRLTDVPRSQVYGAAESLEERGLVEVQKSKPMEYRPVSLDEAQSRLEERFEREQSKVFDYLEDAKRESCTGEEEREDIWTVQGRDTISHRIENILEDAEDRVVFATPKDSLLTPGIEEALIEAGLEGVDVYVVSEDEEVHDRLRDVDEIHGPYEPVKPTDDANDRAGRLVFVDRRTVLLSVLAEDESTDNETAIWSSDTNFASVFIQLSQGLLDETLP